MTTKYIICSKCHNIEAYIEFPGPIYKCIKCGATHVFSLMKKLNYDEFIARGYICRKE